MGAGESDYERAGGALTGRYLTSGTTAITVDFGALSGAPTPRAVARFAAGAAQRGWRYDLYRTKLADKAKPTLAPITIAGAPAGTDADWTPRDALPPGLSLTRQLATHPPRSAERRGGKGGGSNVTSRW